MKTSWESMAGRCNAWESTAEEPNCRSSYTWESHADVVIVGTGVAGLTCARNAAAAGLSVVVVTKEDPAESNTRYAQGGVAVVRDQRDTGDCVAAHVLDTLAAGVGLCDAEAVGAILAGGRGAIARLINLGAQFDAGPQGLLRTREGGHHADRVIHAGGDATGAEIERALLAADVQPVTLEEHQALDVLLTENGFAAGISVLAPDGSVGVIRAGSVVLATGGSGQVFAASTNPEVATADGLAMALRAGALSADLEFIQFHPTALFDPAARTGRRPLVTEAVRGAGATLLDGAGSPVMAGVHPLGDLAPRDVVSLAISRRLRESPGGIGDHVFLDARGIGEFDRRFPTVTASCREVGVNPAVDLIPVSPAAHYHCGGVLTDLDGRTTVPGLYAIGEVARTGLHGANRLASNSLLEGLVMGERVAQVLRAEPDRIGRAPNTTWLRPGRTPLQTIMSRYAGIGRTAAGLTAIASMTARTHSAAGPLISRDAVETTNLALVSEAIASAAAYRTESRGCHVRTDHPQIDGRWGRSSLLQWQDGRARVWLPGPVTKLAGVAV